MHNRSEPERAAGQEPGTRITLSAAKHDREDEGKHGPRKEPSPERHVAERGDIRLSSASGQEQRARQGNEIGGDAMVFRWHVGGLENEARDCRATKRQGDDKDYPARPTS
jgi:hypothetical protein